MRKALLFSGTSDGSRLALCLAGRGWLVTVCTATEYGERHRRHFGSASDNHHRRPAFIQETMNCSAAKSTSDLAALRMFVRPVSARSSG